MWVAQGVKCLMDYFQRLLIHCYGVIQWNPLKVICQAFYCIKLPEKFPSGSLSSFGVTNVSSMQIILVTSSQIRLASKLLFERSENDHSFVLIS